MFEKLVKFYHKSDVFILPSRYETWGLTINESMSAGNAILASEECGASYDLVKNNINGYKVDNFQSLSKKIIYLMNINKSKRTKIINSTFMYSQKFYFKNIKKKWVSLISK